MEVYRQRTVKTWRRIFHDLVHTNTDSNKQNRYKNFQLKLEKSRYNDSHVWKAVREEKLESTGYKCEICGGQPEIMQVHHLNYDRVGGKELLEDLQSVCKSCHATLHGFIKPKEIKVDHDEINKNNVLAMMNSGDVYWESFHRIHGW